jgi:outer membrane protein
MFWAALLLVGATATVTLDEAVRTALENHPDVLVGRGQAEAAHASARIARGALLPSIDLKGHYEVSASESAGIRSTRGSSYNASVAGGLLLWDFGQTWNRWRSSRALADAADGDEERTLQDLILNVRLAYLDAVETKALEEVAKETLDNQEQHLEQTREFVRAGTRPEIDLAKIRTRVAQARATFIRATNSHRVAKTKLNQTMGRTTSAPYDVAEPELPALPWEDESIDRLFALALAQRPELAAARSTVHARELSFTSASRHFWPSLRLVADASYSGESSVDSGWGAATGLTLSVPLFEGLGPSASAATESAGLVVARASLHGLEQQIWQEVEAARIEIESTRAELEAAHQAVTSAEDLLRLAEERYRAGVGDSLELSDAQLELTNATATRVRAKFAMATARARLARAVGEHGWLP